MASKWLQNRLSSLKARWVGPRSRGLLDEIHDYVANHLAERRESYHRNLDRILQMKELASAIAHYNEIGRLCEQCEDLMRRATEHHAGCEAYTARHNELVERINVLRAEHDPLQDYRARRDAAG